MMDTTIKAVTSHYRESAFRRWWKSLSFIQRRMIRMCLSMLVMILCFPLYYSGLFGTVDGPLHPSRIGQSLASMGVTQTHIVALLLVVLIIAATWNWVFNLLCLAKGARLTCNREMDGEGTVCGARVERSRSVNRKTGQSVAQYVCIQGHRRPDAHFHPARKGALGNALWMISMAFVVMVIFM